jgi:hypothetical protein
MRRAIRVLRTSIQRKVVVILLLLLLAKVRQLESSNGSGPSSGGLHDLTLFVLTLSDTMLQPLTHAFFRAQC